LVEPKEAVAGTPASLGGTSALEPEIELKQAALWASLIGGVALLGWMAWRLWRQIEPGTRP
jgi:hypothetical protein